MQQKIEKNSKKFQKQKNSEQFPKRIPQNSQKTPENSKKKNGKKIPKKFQKIPKKIKQKPSKKIQNNSKKKFQEQHLHGLIWNKKRSWVPQVLCYHLPRGRIYRIRNQKEKARQTQNTKQRHKRPQRTTYYSGPQTSRRAEQMQYKCRVHMQSKCTILNTTWTLIHTKGLVNIIMATCAKQSHICSQWFMHSRVCMPCVSTSIAQLIKYYATNVIPS